MKSKEVSIREFQKIIKDIYYTKDKLRGKELTFFWFIEEIGELARSLKTDADLENRKQEFSDVLAWLFSLANLYDIDIDEALSRYYKACPKCGKKPCICK